MLETPTVIQSIINGFDRSPSRLASDLVLAFSCLSLTLLQRWALTPWARLLSWLYRRCLPWRQGRKEQPLLLSFVGPIGCVVDLVHHLVLRCLGCAQMGSPDTRPFWDHTRLCLFSRRLYSLLVLGRFVGRWSSPTCRSARLGYRGFSTRYLSIVTYLCRSCAAFRARLMDHVRFCRIVIIFGGS